MATLQDYLGITKLRDAWPKWKANVIAINNQVIDHVAGSADKHLTSDITNDSEEAGTTTADAINTNKAKVAAHVAGTADKHAAENITYTSTAGGTDVNTAINSLKSDIDNVAAGGTEHDALVTAALVDADGVDFGAGGLGTYLDGRLTKWEQDAIAYKAETASELRNQIMNSGSIFRVTEGYSMICHLGGAVNNVVPARCTVNQISPAEIEIVKTSADSPAVIEFTEPFLMPDISGLLEFVVHSKNMSDLLALEFRIYTGEGGYYTKHLAKYYIDEFWSDNKPQAIRFYAPTDVSGTVTTLHTQAGGKIYLAITAPVGFQMTIRNGFFMVKPASPVAIQFDDGRISVYEKAFPLMKQRGIPGTFNVITGQIGSVGYVTWEQLHEMQDAGWTICNHTQDHTNLMSGDLETAIRSAENGSFDLAIRGFRGARFLAPPYNALDSTRDNYFKHIALGKKLGASFRTVFTLHKADGGTAIIESQSVITETPAQLRDAYLEYVADNSMFSCCFHVIKDSGPLYSTEYLTSDFESLLDLLLAENALFANVESVYRSYARPFSDMGGFTR